MIRDDLPLEFVRVVERAAIAAARRGLAVELRGSGRVVAQVPEPGTRLEPGMVCLFRLSRAPMNPPGEGQ